MSEEEKKNETPLRVPSFTEGAQTPAQNAFLASQMMSNSQSRQGIGHLLPIGLQGHNIQGGLGRMGSIPDFNHANLSAYQNLLYNPAMASPGISNLFQHVNAAHQQHLNPPQANQGLFPVQQGNGTGAVSGGEDTSKKRKKKPASVGSKNGKLTDEEKKAKRRAAVAAASRATRAKRKRELEELKQKNKRLEQERQDYLNTIAELQMKVQALRETGSIDIRMENDLLRAELQEHKKFVSQFKRVSDAPGSQEGRRNNILQASDTAAAQILGLASTSMVDPSWRHGCIPSLPECRLSFQRLPHSSNNASARRITFRVDGCFLSVPKEAVAEALYSYWSTADNLGKALSLGGSTSLLLREEPDILGNEFSPQGFSSGPAVALVKDPSFGDLDELGDPKDRGRIKAFTFDDETSDGGSVSDVIFVLTARIARVSHSSFPRVARRNNVGLNQISEELKTSQNKNIKTMVLENPFALEISGVGKPEGTPSNAEDVVSNNQQVLGGVQGEILKDACNLTSSIVIALTTLHRSLDVEPLWIGASRIRSALLEGFIVRDAELTSATTSSKGSTWTAIFSFPLPNEEHPLPAEVISKLPRSEALQSGIVDGSGTLLPDWEAHVKAFVSSVEEALPHAL